MSRSATWVVVVGWGGGVPAAAVLGWLPILRHGIAVASAVGAAHAGPAVLASSQSLKCERLCNKKCHFTQCVVLDVYSAAAAVISMVTIKGRHPCNSHFCSLHWQCVTSPMQRCRVNFRRAEFVPQAAAAAGPFAV